MLLLVILVLSLEDVESICTKRTPLGMSNGLIASSQLSASSSHSDQFKPSQGRLNVASKWCSRVATEVGQYKTEWFQVSFKAPTVINGIAIQGDNEHAPNFIITFVITYLVEGKWIIFNNQTFSGNKDNNPNSDSDNDHIVYNWFNESLTARRIRIFARDIYRRGDPKAHSCLRIELYGCMNSVHILPLGMQSSIIGNSQLTSNGQNKEYGRLFNFNKDGLKININDSPLYLIIDIRKKKIITGVALQGLKVARVTLYSLETSHDGSNFFNLIELKGNEKYGTDPVLSVLETPLVGRYVRIKSINMFPADSFYNMKVELFGYDAVCHDALNSLTTSASSYLVETNVDSPTAWCASDDDSIPYFHISYTKPIVISGIVLQGDSNADNWVKNFTFSYGLDVKQMIKSDQQFIGNSDRISPLSINWLTEDILVKELRIYPTQWNNKCCLRFAVRGCEKVLSDPHSLTLQQSVNDIRIGWKKPTHLPIPLSYYIIDVTTNKPYNSSFYYKSARNVSSTGETNVSYVWKDVFGVTKYNITISAFVGNISTTVNNNIFVKPLDPPEPQLSVNVQYNTFSHKKTMLSFCAVTDINGPISVYQIIISTEILGSVSMRSLSLENATNMPYFLGATVNAETLSINSKQTYVITEGEETVPGLNVKLPTIGIFHIYIRAVILKEDIAKYVSVGKNYYGTASYHKLERKNLKKPVYSAYSSVLQLVKGPKDTKFYQIIVMEVNETTVKFNSTSSYSKFKTYQDAIINEPYIAAAFPDSQYEDMKNFTLGDNKVYTVNITARRKKRSVNGNYLNGKLTPKHTYAVFQRVVLNDGTSYSTPWIPTFSIPVPPTGKPSNIKSDSNIIGLIAGIAVGCTCFILLFIIFFFIKRRRNSKARDNLSGNGIGLTVHPMSTETTEFSDIDVLHGNMGYIKTDAEKQSEECYSNIDVKPRFSPISIYDFKMYYLKQKDIKNSEIVQQFEAVPFSTIHSCDEAKKPENKIKNRYQNIIPYDHTRVKLELLREKSDYINANYIQGYYGENAYIATQAPTSETVNDFWQMILCQKPPAIVMVTNLKEQGKTKCVQYWPEQKQSYRGIMVEIMEIEYHADYIIRKMTVAYGKESHELRHFHFTSWPDHGCPEYPTLLLNFCYRFRNLVPYNNSSPVVVHCSAGVGRSGTFIVIDAMVQLMKEKGVIDIFNYFETIRQNRAQMIQTIEQYWFVYNALYECVCCDYTGIAASSFTSTLRKLLSQRGRSGIFLMEQEYQRLNDVTPVLDESYFVNSLKDINMRKNRFPKILARDSHLLSTTDYINAVYIDGYKEKQNFIATQAPLDDTIKDLWTIVLEHKVTTIVVLYHMNEQKTEYPVFWPEIDQSRFGDVTVKIISEMKNDYLFHQKINVCGKKGKRSSVNLLQLSSNWRNHDIPNTDQVIRLIEEVTKSQQALGNGKILVTCSDGANRSGTFIACVNAIDQIKMEQHVDIFQIIRRMRLVRPEFVENLRQYQFIYNIVDSYLDSFSTYSNFQ